MAKYTKIEATKPDGSIVRDIVKDMSVQEAVEIARNFRNDGFADIHSITGYPVYCSWCGCVADVSNIEHSHGMCQYCKNVIDKYETYKLKRKSDSEFQDICKINFGFMKPFFKKP